MTWTEQVARSSGRPYVAKRRPSVQTFDDGWDHGGVIVLRTHDVDAAVAMVWDEWAGTYGGSLPAPHVCWLKLVPWDEGGHGFDYTWAHATERTRGAVPCVVFTAP